MGKDQKIKMRIEGETLVIEVPLRIIHKFPKLSDPISSRDVQLLRLAPQQRKILNEILRGNQNKQIADHMNLSINTVKHHVGQILQTLHVSNRYELFYYLRSKSIEQVQADADADATRTQIN